MFQHDLAAADTPDLVELLWKHNQPLYERLDRGSKASMSRAYSRRKEELATVLSALAGVAPPDPETGEEMTQEQFFNEFSKLAAKAGPQAVAAISQVFQELGGVKSYKDLPSTSYRKAIEMLQQVIDNKGK